MRWIRVAFAACVLLALSLAGCAILRPGGEGDTEPFSIVILPDTQYYSQKFPETYLAQTKWIKSKAKRLNIRFVIHVGDIVENPGVEGEWKAADRAHRVLDGKVPYSVLPGNHDGAPDSLGLYNKYFGPSRFAEEPWYGGSITPTSNGANYCRFTAGGVNMMVLSLPYAPSKGELAWAADVAAKYPDDQVILATHAYRNPRGHTPQGRLIWEELVRKTPNIFMVICGHVPAVAHGIRKNDSGAGVHEILSDYQRLPNGGSGWLQVMRFDPAAATIRVEAYSPLLDEYKTEEPHTYELVWEMLGKE